MNAHLVRAAGLQSTPDEGTRPERFDYVDVGDRSLTFARRAAAAPAVAAVADQPRLDPPFLRHPANDRQIPTADRVSAELLSEMLLRLRRPREYHQPARIAVDAVDRPQPAAAGDQPGQVIGERLRQEAFAARAELGR